MNGKSIQVYLPQGEIDGIKVASIANRDLEGIFIPRSKINLFEENKVAIYLLVGIDEKTEQETIYVGETEEVAKRITQHDKGKTFWDYAIVFISKTGDLNKADIKFLEYNIYEQIKGAARYKLENSSVPKESHVVNTRKAELFDYLETIKFILGAAYRIYPFKSIYKQEDIQYKKQYIELLKNEIDEEEKEIFYINKKEIQAKGYLLGEEKKFVVLAGSTGRIKLSATNLDLKSARCRLYDQLLAQGVIEEQENNIIFTTEYIFNSPSQASDLLTLTSTNGWKTWKNSEEEELDKLR